MTLGFLMCTTRGKTTPWTEVKNYGGGAYFRGLTKVFLFVCVKLEMPVSYPNTDVKQAVGFRTGVQKRSLGTM